MLKLPYHTSIKTNTDYKWFDPVLFGSEAEKCTLFFSPIVRSSMCKIIVVDLFIKHSLLLQGLKRRKHTLHTSHL